MRQYKIYDNEGETFDRYTVVFLDEPYNGVDHDMFTCLSMSETSLCGHSGCQDGEHLGKLIKLEDLNPVLKDKVLEYLK